MILNLNFLKRSSYSNFFSKISEVVNFLLSPILFQSVFQHLWFQELISDLLRKDIVMKSMNRMGREVSQEVLKIDRKSTDDVIQTVMRTLNQRWQTVVNLVHSMESNLSPTEVIIASEVTPGLTTASITPNMTPISTSAKTDSVEAKPAKVNLAKFQRYFLTNQHARYPSQDLCWRFVKKGHKAFPGWLIVP